MNTSKDLMSLYRGITEDKEELVVPIEKEEIFQIIHTTLGLPTKGMKSIQIQLQGLPVVSLLVSSVNRVYQVTEVAI